MTAFDPGSPTDRISRVGGTPSADLPATGTGHG